jgi:hypothetical protein
MVLTFHNMAKADIHFSQFLEWEVKYIKDYGEDEYSLLIVILV